MWFSLITLCMPIYCFITISIWPYTKFGVGLWCHSFAVLLLIRRIHQIMWIQQNHCKPHSLTMIYWFSIAFWSRKMWLVTSNSLWRRFTSTHIRKNVRHSFAHNKSQKKKLRQSFERMIFPFVFFLYYAESDFCTHFVRSTFIKLKYRWPKSSEIHIIFTKLNVNDHNQLIEWQNDSTICIFYANVFDYIPLLLF